MNHYDLLIIGSGPAGLAAAIYASRAELNFAVIERSSVSGGQVLSTYEVDNYPGIPGISGGDLSARLREHCDRLGARFITEEVRSIERRPDPSDAGKSIFTLTTWEGSSYEASAVIAATGASHRELGIPGEEDFSGLGVSYCATCDGAFFKDKICAVIGGGNAALEDAIYLSKLCSKVYLIHRRNEFRADASLVNDARRLQNIEFVTPAVPVEISGSDTVSALTVTDASATPDTARRLDVDGVFVAVGITPVSELFTQLAEHDEAGYLRADESCVTTCPGLFAAGDIRTKPLRQIITAAADGANAVASVLKYLG